MTPFVKTLRKKGWTAQELAERWDNTTSDFKHWQTPKQDEYGRIGWVA